MSAREKHLNVDDYLDHIEEAANLATSFVKDMDKSEFLSDKRTQQAVIYNIMIIGEAASQIINGYPEFVELTPEIPWREMRGIRNRMAHGYFALNMEIIWDTVSENLEDLGRIVSEIRSKQGYL
ncbi:MAG: DUF86 domain-containing protein [Desulfuromonadaceae bacterium]